MPASEDYPEPVPEVIPDAVMSAAVRHKPRHPRARVKLSSGLWQDAQVIAWAKCQRGWAARVRWPSGQEDWLLYTPTAVRPGLPRLKPDDRIEPDAVQRWTADSRPAYSCVGAGSCRGSLWPGVADPGDG